LYNFLQAKKLKATHFFIGINILTNPQLFLTAFDVLEDDLAVHTWSHPYLTTLSNEQIFAELAFTMKIIHESSGGRLPRFWRPPYGDTDQRVHAIAKLLGLTTILWNQEWVLAFSWLSHVWIHNLALYLARRIGNCPLAERRRAKLVAIWKNGSGVVIFPSFNCERHAYIYILCQGPKSPGLIILEHELTDDTAQAFINNYYLISRDGWNAISAAEMDGLNEPYQNAQGTTGAVTYAAVVRKQNSVKPRNSNDTNGVVRTSTSGMLALCVAALTGCAAWLS
jgi:chitin deacetylase